MKNNIDTNNGTYSSSLGQHLSSMGFHKISSIYDIKKVVIEDNLQIHEDYLSSTLRVKFMDKFSDAINQIKSQEYSKELCEERIDKEDRWAFDGVWLFIEVICRFFRLITSKKYCECYIENLKYDKYSVDYSYIKDSMTLGVTYDIVTVINYGDFNGKWHRYYKNTEQIEESITYYGNEYELEVIEYDLYFGYLPDSVINIIEKSIDIIGERELTLCIGTIVLPNVIRSECQFILIRDNKNHPVAFRLIN